MERRPLIAILSKTLLFTITFPFTVTFLIPYLLMGQNLPPHPPFFFKIAGGILIFAGVWFYLNCALDFALFGQGTPAPLDPPREIVLVGPYRYTRNPMYIGILMIVAGEATFAVSFFLLLYTVLLWLIFHTWVMIYEEPHLRAIFGAPYTDYCRSVPRWIPTLPMIQ